MQSTSKPALRCAAVIDGRHPRRWEIRVLASLAQAGLAEAVARPRGQDGARVTGLSKVLGSPQKAGPLVVNS